MNGKQGRWEQEGDAIVIECWGNGDGHIKNQSKGLEMHCWILLLREHFLSVFRGQFVLLISALFFLCLTPLPPMQLFLFFTFLFSLHFYVSTLVNFKVLIWFTDVLQTIVKSAELWGNRGIYHISCVTLSTYVYTCAATLQTDSQCATGNCGRDVTSKETFGPVSDQACFKLANYCGCLVPVCNRLDSMILVIVAQQPH